MNKIYSVLLFLISVSSSVLGQSLGLNNPSPDASSIIDMVATDRGVLFPRMTTAQRNAIVSPANGLQIINTTTACLELYWGGVWNSLGCACVSAPAAPTATAGTGLLATQITANWIAASGSTAYYLDVATDNLFTSMVTGFSNLNVSNVTGYNVTGLTCNSTYYYRVRASNNCGTGVNSNVITVVTAAATGPTAIAATGVQQSQFTANWGAIGGATTYYLDVATDASFISYVTGYTDLNVGLVTTATVSGLTCGTTYYYRVRAGTSCGASSNSNTISQATSSSPAVPVATSGSGLLQAQFTANWGAVAGATTYYLDVATDVGFTTFVPGYSGISVGAVTSYNVSGLACNTSYYYRLRATSGCGTSGNSNTITVTTCACTPTSTAATNITAGSFSANWASAGGATSYYLDVATDAAFTAILPAYSNLNVGLVTTYSITSLTCNTAYYYRVRTGSTCAVSGNSGTITATTASTFAATATAASAIAQTQFTANWGSVAGATSYILDVATDAGFGSPVAGYSGLNVGLVINNTIGALACNTPYFYRVRVVNACGTSGNSNTVNPTTCVCTPTATAASGIFAGSFAANWNAVPSATTYYLDVATDNGFTSIVAGYNNLNVGNVVTYNVTGLACNTAYYYRLRASSACGTSVSGNTINVTTLSSVSAATTATAATGVIGTQLNANWNSVAGASSYILDVATDVGFTSFVSGYNNQNVGLVTTYTVSGLTFNTVYYYRVRVVNACGNSLNSNTITTTATVTTCQAIKTALPASTDGVYTIDPDGAGALPAMSCYCDMTTDGGGWTLVLNYLHLGATNPALTVRTNSLPVLGSTVLGTDESASAANWGHAGNSLMNSIPYTTLRFYAKTNAHARVIHFKTTHAGTISYFNTGTGSCTGINGSFTALTGHTANIPASAGNTFNNQGNSSMTEFPYWNSGVGHWGIKGSTTRWEVDDYPNGFGQSTYHQIWVK